MCCHPEPFAVPSLLLRFAQDKAQGCGSLRMTGTILIGKNHHVRPDMFIRSEAICVAFHSVNRKEKGDVYESKEKDHRN